MRRWLSLMSITEIRCNESMSTYIFHAQFLLLYTVNKETNPSRWSLHIALQNCPNQDLTTSIFSLKNSNFIDFTCCQGVKTNRFIWRFDKPSFSSCRLNTALILDLATKKNDCFQCKFQKTFLCASSSKITQCTW